MPIGKIVAKQGKKSPSGSHIVNKSQFHQISKGGKPIAKFPSKHPKHSGKKGGAKGKK